MPDPRTIDELADWIAEAVTKGPADRTPSHRVRSRAIVALMQMRQPSTGTVVVLPHRGVCNQRDAKH